MKKIVLGVLFVICLAANVCAADKKPEPAFKVEELKKGGYVVFMRHARREEIPSQVRLWELDRNASCEAGGSLNIQGESESRSIAKAMRERGIPGGEVFSSPTCRTKQMAHILFGDDFQINRSLSPEWARQSSRKAEDAAALKALLGKPVAAGTNRFLISHNKMLTKASAGQEIQLDQTESAVFRPNGKGGFKFVGVIKADDWK